MHSSNVKWFDEPIDRLTEDELDWILEAEAVALMGD